MEIMRFAELPSTSTYVRENAGLLGQFACVTADFQTAGRGQRGNGWESEPGKNLLFSMLWFPPEELHPSRQFLISKAVSLAVAEVVDSLLAGCQAPEVAIKWPNDIYIGDGKVAGILIEHSLRSARSIDHTVIGIGLNLNQRRFCSGAPNPVSVIGFTDREIPVEQVAAKLRDSLVNHLSSLASMVAGLPTDFGRPEYPMLDERYSSRLWRRRGFHPWCALAASSRPAPTALSVSPGESLTLTSQTDASSPADTGSTPASAADVLLPGTRFEAEIVSVASDGPITLRLRNGALHTFRFKELTPLLPAH